MVEKEKEMDKSPENTEGFETLEPKDITRRLADMAKKLLLVYVQSFEEPIVLQLLVEGFVEN